jgi:hypothetical protein
MVAMRALLALVALAAARASAPGWTPPLFPSEFMANVQQHKWNENGALVDHYYLMTW